MASEKQIEANRLNAQNSTGPRSVEGKAAPRHNALKTGIDAQLIVHNTEDPRAFAALVDTLANAEWQFRRFRQLEAITRLYRRQDNAQRTFHRALTGLERVQSNRPRSEEHTSELQSL